MSIGALLLVAAIPWGVGRLVERTFVTRVEELTGGANALLRMRLVRYERGWLVSEAVHRVELDDASSSFDLVHRIDHLPRVGEGWARVRSVPQWRGAARERMAHYFDDNAPVTVDTVVGFHGNLSMQLRSPAFDRTLAEEPDVRMTWGGAQGELQVSADGKARARLAVPGLAMHGQGVIATFADLRIQGDWQSTPDPAAWSGETQLIVSAIGLSSPEGGARLRHVEAAIERRDRGDTIGLSCRVRIGEGTALDERDREGFRNGVIALHLEQLDKKALRTYLERMSDLPAALPQAQQSRANAQLALVLLADLLEGAPRLRIEQAGLTTAKGGFSATGVLGFDPERPGTSESDLLARLRLELGVDVSASLLEAWLSRDTYRGVEAALLERGGEVDEALAQELTQRFVRERIDTWTAAGMVVADRDRYKVQIQLARGHLRVNGVPSDALLSSDRMEDVPAGASSLSPHGQGAAPQLHISGEIASVPDKKR